MQVYLNRINSSADTGLAIHRCAWLETLVKGLTLKQVNATVAFAKVTLKMTDRRPDRCSASPALFLSNISRLWSSFGPHRCYGHFRRMFTMTQDKYSYWSHGYRCRWMILPCPNSLFRVSRLASRLGPEFDPKWLVTTTRSDNWSAMSKTRPDQHAYYALSYVCGSMILNGLFDFSYQWHRFSTPWQLERLSNISGKATHICLDHNWSHEWRGWKVSDLAKYNGLFWSAAMTL